MLKRLAMLVLLVGLQFSSYAQSPTIGTPAAPLIVDVKEHSKKSSPDWWNISLTAVIAIAAISQAIGIFGQIAIYRRQTEVMKGSLAAAKTSADAALTGAEASLQQAQFLIDAERAWVLETIDFPPKILPVQPVSGPMITVFVSFSFKNYGKSPARILDIKLNFHRIEYPNRLADVPDYAPSVMPELGSYGRMMAADQGFSVALSLQGQTAFEIGDAVEVAAKQVGIYAYGVVEYETLGKKFFTQFCYEWFEPQGLVTDVDRPGFRIGGPAKYNRAT